MPKDIETFFKEIKIPEGGSIGWGAPAISGNKLIFGACDKYLYCLDRGTGKVIWRFLTGGAITSPANIVKDKVLFSSMDKHLYCLSLKTGELLWKKIFPSEPWGGPTCADDTIYVGCNDNSLYAIALDDASIRWNFRTGGIVTSSTAVINNSIYFGSFDKNFYCLDLEGKLKWKFLAGGHIDWSLGISDNNQQIWSIKDRNGNKNAESGMIYFGSYDNCLYALSLDGDFRWKFLTGNIVISPPTIFNSNIYFGSWDRNFYSLDTESGKMNWRFVTGGFIDVPAFISDNTVYFGSYDNNLYALGIDGRKAWTFTTGGFVVCPPVVVNGILYFGSCDTFMYAIRLKDRKLIWKFQTSMPAASFEHHLKEFVELVKSAKAPFTFSDWKPETLKKSYDWQIEVGKLVTSPYKSANPYMNKPVYRMDSPYHIQKKKEPWER